MTLLMEMTRDPAIHSVRQSRQSKETNRRVVPPIPCVTFFVIFPMIKQGSRKKRNHENP